MSLTLRNVRGLGIVLAFFTIACSAAANSGRAAPVDRSTITTAELRASHYPNAFEAVRVLRPHWLRKRGPSTLTQSESIKVYLDGTLLGTPDQLVNIMPASVSSLHFLDGVAATQRFGLDHGHGAIVVATRDSKGGLP